jgi:hypothetical protein
MRESMNEDIKEYIDKKMRIGKMDSFLLYLTSLFGFLYSLTQFFFSSIEDILYFIPLLIPGLILPVYFGYYRGALRDSAEDRIRGWVYLMVGTPFYSIQFLSSFIQKHIEQYVSISVTRIVPILLAFLIGFLIGMFGSTMGQKLERFTFYLCGKESSFATKKMMSQTSLSALFLSAALSISPLLRHSSLTEFPGRFLFIVLFLIIACILGRSSGKWSIVSKHFEYIKVRQSEPLPKYYFFQTIKKISLGLLIGFTILILFIETPLTGSSLIIGTVLLLIIFSLGVFSTIVSERYSPKTILEIKDDVEIPHEIKKVLEEVIKKLS